MTAEKLIEKIREGLHYDDEVAALSEIETILNEVTGLAEIWRERYERHGVFEVAQPAADAYYRCREELLGALQGSDTEGET